MPNHIQCPKTGQPVPTCDMLLDLLRVAHRDGGQYFTEHGVEQAYRDARGAILEAYYQEGVYRRKAAEAYAEMWELKARIAELEACLHSIKEHWQRLCRRHGV